MTITLQYTYLQHDIDQWTYRLGKTRIQDEALRNEAQSSSVSTDISFYRRKIVEAIAAIRTMLKNRLYDRTATGTDTLSTTASSWTITLTDVYYQCDAQSIADLMHKYVVRSVMTDWALAYAPDSAPNMATELEAIKQELITEIYNRKHPDLADHITDTVTIKAEPNNAAYGSVEGGGTYAKGITIILTATPKSGYAFTQWTDGSSDSQRAVTTSTDTTYTATFEALA